MSGQPHCPALVQHEGPKMMLQLGQLLPPQLTAGPPPPVLPPEPGGGPWQALPVLVKPERQLKSH
jgi:hypothetical protein